MEKATIFNIQKFSIHDGPGIRTTVFFKGCPLNCMWCHNPESQRTIREVMYERSKCSLCGNCARHCTNNAIALTNDSVITNTDKCSFCKECTYYCPNEAREFVGDYYTVEDVLKKVLQDKVFYEQSGGGVTVSGGEPLMQIKFVTELLKQLKEQNINTAVDTSGAVPYQAIENVIPYTDIFLYDIKAVDDEVHKKYVGMSNKLILENLQKLSKCNKDIYIRLPIIEGVNATKSHIKGVLDIIRGMNIKKVNILPYHDIAKHKYNKLGIQYQDELMSKPTDEKIEEFKNMFAADGYDTKIGG